MSRQIVRIKGDGTRPGLTDLLPLTERQIRAKMCQLRNPIPYKKSGKVILFDMEQVWAWFDSLPGKGRMIPGGNIRPLEPRRRTGTDAR